VYRLDVRIDSKLEQARALRGSALKATTVLSDMPRSSSPALQPMESIIAQYVDLEREITAEIDALVDVKREVAAFLEQIPRSEYRAVLERRYLCLQTWSAIADGMSFDKRYIFKLHNRALAMVEEFLGAAQ
jgi:hypothetical protein